MRRHLCALFADHNALEGDGLGDGIVNRDLEAGGFGKFPICVEKALKARLKPVGGSNCPVAFEIEVQGYAP